jgi:hypothetical protein
MFFEQRYTLALPVSAQEAKTLVEMSMVIAIFMTNSQLLNAYAILRNLLSYNTRIAKYFITYIGTKYANT